MILIMCPYDTAYELIDTLLTTLRKHTKNGTVRLVTMPGKDIYCEILTLLVNIVNESSGFINCQMLSSICGSYLFGNDDENPMINDEIVLFPFLENDALNHKCKLDGHDKLVYIVYEKLFRL